MPSVILGLLFLGILTYFYMSSNSVFAHHILDEIKVPRPMAMSIDDDGLLYVSSMGKSGISVVNTTNDKIIYVINSTLKGDIIDAISTPDKVYLAPFKSGIIKVFDKNIGNISNLIKLPGAIYSTSTPLVDRGLTAAEFVRGVWSLDYDSQNKVLYAAYADANEILAINTTTDDIIAKIPVANHPMALKVDPLTNTLIVASLSGNKITFISTETNQVISEVATGVGLWDIALDSLYHKAYVANRGSYFVTVLDTISHEITDKIPLSSPAQALTVDEEDHVVYVVHPRSQNIDKIDGRTNEFITTVVLKMIPQDIVADSKTQKVYVSATSHDNILVIGPESMSSTLGVTWGAQPFVVLGFITVHGQDISPTSLFSLTNHTLNISILAPDGGNLAFDIPRSLLDSKNGTQDTSFRLLIDGQQSKYSENIEISKSNNNNSGAFRSLNFHVPENTTTISIVGTQSLVWQQNPFFS